MSATKTLTKPLSIFQKIVLTGGATVLCALNPYRDDMVAVLGEMSCPYTLAKIHKRMTADETGRLILKDKPVINSKTINFDSLSTLPHNTFGKTYYDFMTKRNISPDTRKKVRFVADTEHEYIVQRYREIHDLLHVLHGIPINLYGELALKAREFFLTKMMLSGLSCAFAPIGLSKVQMKYFFKVAVPWAIYSACESVDLMNIFYEKHFEEDIDELRRQWGIVTLPGIKGLR